MNAFKRRPVYIKCKANALRIQSYLMGASIDAGSCQDTQRRFRYKRNGKKPHKYSVEISKTRLVWTGKPVAWVRAHG